MASSQYNRPAEGASRGKGDSGNRPNFNEQTWEPYQPPEPRGGSGFVARLRRHSFLIVLILATIGFGALLYFNPQPNYSGTSLNEGYSTLSIYSTPSTASVVIRKDTVGVTPLENHHVEPGIYRISVKKENYVDRDTLLTLRAGQSTVYSPQLGPRFAVSDAAQTSTREPTSVAGTGPDPTPDEPQGQSSAQESSSESASARPPGEELDPEPFPADEATSPETGTLQLRSTPESTTVELNGETAGTTPLTLDGVPAGTHEVTFTHSSRETVTRRVEVTAGEEVNVQVSPEVRTGRLRILVRPWGSISIEGELRVQDSDVWYETELPAGTHDVTVRHPSYGQERRAVEVPAADTHSVVFNLREE